MMFRGCFPRRATNLEQAQQGGGGGGGWGGGGGGVGGGETSLGAYCRKLGTARDILLEIGHRLGQHGDFSRATLWAARHHDTSVERKTGLARQSEGVGAGRKDTPACPGLNRSSPAIMTTGLKFEMVEAVATSISAPI